MRLVPDAAEYRAVAPTYSSGSVVPLQADTHGRLLVTAVIAAGGSTPVAALSSKTIAVPSTAGGVLLAASDAARTMLVITCNTADPFYCSRDVALVSGDVASALHGARILVQGESIVCTVDDPEGPALTQSAWFAISAAGKSPIAAVELGT